MGRGGKGKSLREKEAYEANLETKWNWKTRTSKRRNSRVSKNFRTFRLEQSFWLVSLWKLPKGFPQPQTEEEINLIRNLYLEYLDALGEYLQRIGFIQCDYCGRHVSPGQAIRRTGLGGDDIMCPSCVRRFRERNTGIGG